MPLVTFLYGLWEIEMNVKNRFYYNLKILEELIRLINKEPELRFIQALWALNLITRDKDMVIEDKFYEEPWDTLERIERFNDEKNKTSKKSKEDV